MLVLAWVCREAPVDGLLRDSHVMQALGLSEAEAQTALGDLKARGLIESHRTLTEGLQGYHHSVWGIRPTPQGELLAGGSRAS